MNFLRLSSCVAIGFLAAASPVLAQEKADPGYTEEEYYDAKVLFAEFAKMLKQNPDKADDPFQAMLQLPDPLLVKVQAWLDERWAESKRDYFRGQAAPAGGTLGGPPLLTASDKLVLSENRDLLLEIRRIADEEEMKKRLKAEGWEALGGLVRITNPAAAKDFVGEPLEEEGEEYVDPLLAKALVYGQYRYQLRKKRGEEAVPPQKEINQGAAERAGAKSDEEAAAAAEKAKDEDNIAVYDAKSGAVLRENAKMKDQIPRAEYEGILELNHWRIALGLNPLLIDPKLCEASRDHSKDMATLGFFAHDSPVKDKKTPWDRAKNFGTTARAENIAINGSTSGANQAWFYSPGHHKNMFAGHTVIGLGVHGRHYTQMFR